MLVARHEGSGRSLPLVFLVLAFGVGYWFQREGLVDLDPRDLRTEIESLGWWAPVVFMAAAASRPFLLLPSFVVMSVGGMLFGWLGGVVFSTLGFSFGAIVVFLLARGMGREAIQKRVAAGRLAAVDAFLSDRGAPWLGFYTALPVTFLTPAFAASGLSGMPLGGFALWVTLGLVSADGPLQLLRQLADQGGRHRSWWPRWYWGPRASSGSWWFGGC